MQEDEIVEFFETFNEKPTSYALVSYINKENEVKAAVLDMVGTKDFKTLSPWDLDYMKMMLWMQKSKKTTRMMNGIYTILLLVLSNIFMTLAWYGHLKLQQTGTSSHWPLIGVIAFSWAIAFFEYCCQVPANRIGFVDNGGPFNLVQLKVIQECVSLIIFAIIANILFQGQGLHWNHAAAFICLIAAVYFVFMK